MTHLKRINRHCVMDRECHWFVLDKRIQILWDLWMETIVPNTVGLSSSSRGLQSHGSGEKNIILVQSLILYLALFTLVMSCKVVCMCYNS